MADEKSTQSAENSLISRRSDEERYTSALQLARQLNASPDESRTGNRALKLFNALSAKREQLLPVAMAAGGLAGVAIAGIAALTSSRRSARRSVQRSEPDRQVAMITQVLVQADLTQSFLSISSHTVRIERFRDEE